MKQHKAPGQVLLDVRSFGTVLTKLLKKLNHTQFASSGTPCAHVHFPLAAALYWHRDAHHFWDNTISPISLCLTTLYPRAWLATVCVRTYRWKPVLYTAQVCDNASPDLPCDSYPTITPWLHSLPLQLKQGCRILHLHFTQWHMAKQIDDTSCSYKHCHLIDGSVYI